MGLGILVGGVPFVCHFFFPVDVLLHVVHSVLYHSQSLSNFQVFHVFLVVELVREFKQVVDFIFLCCHLLLFSNCPGRFSSSSFGFLRGSLGSRRSLLRNLIDLLQVFLSKLDNGRSLFSAHELLSSGRIVVFHDLDLFPLLCCVFLELLGFLFLVYLIQNFFLPLDVFLIFKLFEEPLVLQEHGVGV